MPSRPESTHRRLLPLAAAAGVLLAVTGCGSSAKPAAGSSSGGGGGGGGNCSSGPAGSGPTAAIKNFAFNPCPLTVKTGAKVTWTNDKSDPTHTVTADSSDPSMFDSGNLKPGGTFSFTFDKPGKYTYTCTIHPFMHGEVDVTS